MITIRSVVCAELIRRPRQARAEPRNREEALEKTPEVALRSCSRCLRRQTTLGVRLRVI